MVWTVPPDPGQAEAALSQMHRMGVEAVRTGLIRHERLLSLADSLGLQFFQELPLDYVPAPQLSDTLEYALRLLEGAVAQARNHPSARHFGLARRSDTSDPQACPFFEQLAERVHRAPGSQVYYLSTFIEAERCADTVDFVLLDALDATDAASLPARWKAAHPTARARVGIGALGWWISARTTTGLRTPRSSQSQARYLETNLGTLLSGTTDPLPYAVFVYRWHDVPTPTPSPARDLNQPYLLSYGLHADDGRPRPARDVVAGFYTETQTVFAFPSGDAPPQGIPWILLIGWLVFILIAVPYALSPRLRHMVPRYFLSHGFYREGIREGRDVLLGASVVLLVATALSAGVLGSVFLDVMRQEAAFRFLFRLLPEPVQPIGVALLAQPWMMVLLLGSFYALGIALWTPLLSLASRRRRPLVPGQVLMLVLWARWPFPLLMAGAMIASTLSHRLAILLMLGLAGGWMVTTCLAIFRTLRDYAAITRVSFFWIAVIGLANPLLLLILLGFVWSLDLGPALSFFWHLATRS
ncbi:MAG: hypothetical protein ACE5G0_13185 [Rhodothermales bacterium]